MRASGAYISTRKNTEGQNVPYEINVTYFDAFRNAGNQSAPWQVARFLLSQTVALSMRGIPGIYIHSLLATPNDHEHVEVTGKTRSINRHQWNIDELDALLEVPESSTYLLMNEYLRRIKIRREKAAFHPDATQDVLDLNDKVLGVVRVSLDCEQKIVALYNFSKKTQLVSEGKIRPILGEPTQWIDALHDVAPEKDGDQIVLKPYDCLWLTV